MGIVWRLSVLLICFCSGPCANTWLLVPKPGATESHAARSFVVRNDEFDIEMYAATNSPAAPQAYVLEFTGNATRAEQVFPEALRRWGNHPVEVWVVNYPGYGRSVGPPRIGQIPDAALVAYDSLRHRAGKAPIFITGNSLGTAVALYVATQRPCAGLVLQNPPPLRELLMGKYGWFDLWLVAGPLAAQVPNEFDSISNAEKLRGPVVFMSGQADELVPLALSRDGD